MEYQDWRGLTPAEQDERLTAYLGSDRRRGFVPSQPPLSRLTLVRLGENVHQLIWSIHHAVIDGWCLSVLLHEVLDIYEAIRRGREPALKPIRPFRDYVAWLRDRDDDTGRRILAASPERRHRGDAAGVGGSLVGSARHIAGARRRA